MVARQKASPKSSFWKTHPPHPDVFLCRWGVWCCEGSGVSPSREDIGSLSDFPSFRDEAQLDRCSQKWSKIEKYFWKRKFRGRRENENPWISSDSRFSKISKSDHIHFCSLEAKDQSSSQLSLFPGDILVPGAGPKEPNVPPTQKVGWKVVDCVWIYSRDQNAISNEILVKTQIFG